MENVGCCTDRNRVCYSRSICNYSGEIIDYYARKCNAYEMTNGHLTCCSGLSALNKIDTDKQANAFGNL